MQNLMTKIFWWWGWDSSKMEKMLEDMALSGWQLYHMDWMGIRFSFQMGEAQKVRYCADYQPTIDGDYLSIYQEAGWQMKWTGANGWYLWVKAYEGEKPEIFSDTTSLIDRNNRLIKVLKPLFIMLLVLFIILLATQVEAFRPLIALYVAIIALYTFIFYQVYSHNQKLKDNIKE